MKWGQRFTKAVWAASAVVGAIATYALSFLPTPMSLLYTGVQQLGVPAPIWEAPVVPGATLRLVPSGLVVDLLFWFVVAATVLSAVAYRWK